MDKKLSPEELAQALDDAPELSAEAILEAKDITIKPVLVPEWGGKVYVRVMSGTDRERYIESIRKVVGTGKKKEFEIILAESGAKLAQRTICDKFGKLLFSTAQIAKLGEKSSTALQRCIDASAELNGFSDAAEEEAKNDSPVSAETNSSSNSASPVI